MKRDHLRLFSRYNHWANQTLYEAVAALPEAEIARDRRGFFGSILGTLNHLLVADRVWIARLLHQDYGWFTALDQHLHDDFAALRQARADTDRQFLALADSLDLEGDLTYRNSQGEAMQTPKAIVLTHIFNHQTHHRGQAHGMLSQAGQSPPPLDFLYFTRVAAP